MRLVHWGDVWVFWDTSSQTAVRLRIGHLGAQRTFRLQVSAPRRARHKKGVPSWGTPLLQELATLTASSRSRTSRRVARLYPRHWLISSLWKKICPNGAPVGIPNPLFGLAPTSATLPH